MKSIFKVLFVLCAAFASSAQADVIDFEDVPEGTISTDVVSNGFRFLANRNGAIYFTNGVACDPVCASNGTRTMLAPGPLLGGLGFADQVAVMRAGGGEFILSSLEAAEVFSFPQTQDSAARIEFVGLLGGLVVASGSLELDLIVDGPGGVNDFQRFFLPGATVDTYIFTGEGGVSGNDGFTLDNLVVEFDDGQSEVPEPGTLALGLLGALGFAAGRKRRSSGKAA